METRSRCWGGPMLIGVEDLPPHVVHRLAAVVIDLGQQPEHHLELLGKVDGEAGHVFQQEGGRE
eukprot:14859324-Alexandrium_andersonii.AAC.1